MRILGKGELKAKLSFKVAGISKGARKAIEKAGGSVEVIELVSAAEKAKAKKNSVKKRKDAGRGTPSSAAAKPESAAAVEG